MISAISAQGALRFSVLTGTLTAAGFIAFLQRLLHDAKHNGGNPVFCIVDNHPAHRAKAVDRYVASTGGAPRLVPPAAHPPPPHPAAGGWGKSKTPAGGPPPPPA